MACVVAFVSIAPAPFAAFGGVVERMVHRTAGEENIFCRLYLDRHDKFTRVVSEPRPAMTMTGTEAANVVLSDITVNYTGFTGTDGTAALAAFQAAVDIWKTQVASTVPIVVDAEFKDLGATGLLGSAGSGATADYPGTPRADTFYPFPLANKITGTDIGAQFFGAGASNIGAAFNSNASIAWYFGTDGLVPAGKVDFETVVLHELGHGLGFFGQAGLTSFNNEGSIGSGGTPYIYDTFVVDALTGGNSLLNTSVYPNPSTALGAALTSNNLYWDGSNAKSTNGGVRPKLYAPATFLSGSTFSHVDETTYPAGNINSLMTPSINTAEAIHTPGPIMLGMFADMGWGSNTGASCSFGLDSTSATVPAAGVSGTSALSVTVSAAAGCAWTASTSSGFLTITSGASGTSSGVVRITVAANSSSARTGVVTIAGIIYTVTQLGTGPTMALDRTSLAFSGVTNGIAFTSQTGTQAVRLTQSGTGTVTWTAMSNATWLRIAAGSGTADTQVSGSGSATLNVSVQFVPGLQASQTGSITLAFTGAGNFAGPITITLSTFGLGAASQPFGQFETPANGTTGIAGSVAVTGWALDDVAVSRVRILRNPVAGEGSALIYIGDGTFIDGARPDVQGTYPSYPRSTRAGWGYLMLTNFLPNGGNGTFTLYAYADDADGHSALLGTKVITCDNFNSIAPFGAIDTPLQGQTVSGAIINFGWVLSPGTRRADPPGGGVVNVFVDGAIVGSPSGWAARSDITTLFPVAQYSGTNTAVGNYGLDTTTLTNGVHTIFWVVTATSGGTSGVGSRFFTVSNGSLTLDPSSATANRISNVIASRPTLDLPKAAALRIDGPRTLTAEVDATPPDLTTIYGRRGFDLDAPLVAYGAAGGRITVQGEELDRIELLLSSGGRHRYSGYLRTVDGVRPLPVGSALDPVTGAFTWGAGPGFVGNYDLAFVRWSGGRAVARQDVRVVLNPKGSNRLGPQVVIDVPGAAQQGQATVVGSSFFLSGWALDLDSTVDEAVDTVHVWAYPVNAAGGYGQPTFLGPAVFGGARPDVAAVYGARFENSGYGMIVKDLPPGTYDLAVFAYSTIRGGFVPAKTVRVTVR
ncbi:MAG TPA: hypothetical protein VEL51_10995 [Vicinamibacterales bacterium]|nr:hypothetical protein [Vicinamibacterales bacterium]